jgi:hypothetical protein
MSRLNWDADRHRSPSRNAQLVGDDEPVHSKHGESNRKPSKRKPRAAGQRKAAPATDALRERVGAETKLGETKVAIERLRIEPSAELADAASATLRDELAESRRTLDNSGLGRQRTKSMRRELDDLAWDLEEEIDGLRP